MTGGKHRASIVDKKRARLHRKKLQSEGPTITREKKRCSVCSEEKPVVEFYRNRNFSDGFNYRCKKCHHADPRVAIRILVNISMKRYLNGGKSKRSSEYGIDIKAIAESLGPRPSNSHHVDHIIPLAAFDYNDPMQIAASWHPKNLQWLDGPENIAKNGNYDPKALRKYLVWFTARYPYETQAIRL